MNQQSNRHDLMTPKQKLPWRNGKNSGAYLVSYLVYNIHEPNKPKTKPEDQPEEKKDQYFYGACGELQRCRTCKKFFVWQKVDGKNKLYAVHSEGFQWRFKLQKWDKYERFVFDPNSKPDWVCHGEDLTGV